MKMMKPDKKQIEKLKKQDKELAKLAPDKESKKFKSGEAYLKRLLKVERIEVDIKKLTVPSRKKAKGKQKNRR